jgi:hypothetical protein
MRRCTTVLVILLGLTATPVRAGNNDVLGFAVIACGLGLLTTGALAGGLAAWENGAAQDVRKAGNAYRAVPTVANARRIAEARSKWEDAHEFNSTDDRYAWIVGGAGVVSGTICLGILAAAAE